MSAKRKFWFLFRKFKKHKIFDINAKIWKLLKSPFGHISKKNKLKINKTPSSNPNQEIYEKGKILKEI